MINRRTAHRAQPGDNHIKFSRHSLSLIGLEDCQPGKVAPRRFDATRGEWQLAAMSTRGSARPDYGIDAPGVIRNLLVGAGFCYAIVLARVLGWWAAVM